jgi:hypothetical protein
MEKLPKLESKEKYNDFESLLKTIIISETTLKNKKVMIQLLIVSFESLSLDLTTEQEFRLVSLKQIVGNLVCYYHQWNKNLLNARNNVPIYEPKKIPLKIDDILD